MWTIHPHPDCGDQAEGPDGSGNGSPRVYNGFGDGHRQGDGAGNGRGLGGGVDTIYGNWAGNGQSTPWEALC